MHESFHIISYMVRHDPLAVGGFVLMCSFSVLFVHVQFKMREIGYKTYPMFSRPSDWGLPAKYLRVRKQYGWSPWPVYLMLPCLLLGLVALVVGLFLNHD
jgi:hypothetical protein